MITSDGYHENAKAHSCHGRLSMEMVGKEVTADFDYVLQATEGQPDDFLVQITPGREVIGHLSNMTF